jgi:hypothetical protein
MIKEEEQKSQEEIYKELYYLGDAYYRQNLLVILERIMLALEKQAVAMEKLATPSQDFKM